MLNTELLLAAYRRGAFPMAINERGDIGWFSPDPRAIIPLDQRFHISHGLRHTLKKQKFEVTFDMDFSTVIRACATTHGPTWISTEILKSYCQLYREGYAHSVEARLGGEIAGGLYGVHIGGAFFGESMFHFSRDASKVALVGLVERLRSRGFSLLDTQWKTEHLSQFGTFLVPRAKYLEILGKAVEQTCGF